jgi:hypothetical protein
VLKVVSLELYRLGSKSSSEFIVNFAQSLVVPQAQRNAQPGPGLLAPSSASHRARVPECVGFERDWLGKPVQKVGFSYQS